MIADDTDEIARRLAELRSERGRQRVLAEMVETFEHWRERVWRIARDERARAEEQTQ